MVCDDASVRDDGDDDAAGRGGGCGVRVWQVKRLQACSDCSRYLRWTEAVQNAVSLHKTGKYHCKIKNAIWTTLVCLLTVILFLVFLIIMSLDLLFCQKL